MSRTQKILFSLLALTGLLLIWFWWNQPERVEMAAYAPADTLVYLEADSLPEIIRAFRNSKTWLELSEASGGGAGGRGGEWLTRLSELTGVGTAETVILGRAQVAVCVLGFGAAETGESDLKITPRAAVVIETHTSGWRVRTAAERAVGRFARRTLGAGEPRREQRGEALFLTWVAPDDGRKRIVAAIEGTLAVVGNDEAAVNACLAVRRGERPSLAGDPQLREMRGRVGGEDALAFGYAPPGSAARIVEALSPLFSQQSSDDARVRGVLARLLPKLASRTIGAAAWGAHSSDGYFLDRYFLTIPEGTASRLSAAAITAGEESRERAAGLLPADVYQLTLYRYEEPEAAWLALNAGLSTRADALEAPLVTLALEALLKPYGVASPREFLRAAGPGVATARLNQDSEGKVLIVGVRDQGAMRGLVMTGLGEGVRSVNVGDAELLVASDGDGSRAAGFVAGHLVLGSEEDVRACLSARETGRTLSASESFGGALSSPISPRPHVRTLTSDAVQARTLVGIFTRRRELRNAGDEAFLKALERVPYSLSETTVTRDGLERQTRSSFGLLGDIVARFGPRGDAEAASVER
jgi:hypothetical protein